PPPGVPAARRREGLARDLVERARVAGEEELGRLIADGGEREEGTGRRGRSGQPHRRRHRRARGRGEGRLDVQPEQEQTEDRETKGTHVSLLLRGAQWP